MWSILISFPFFQAHITSCEFVKFPCVHPECGMLVKKADLPQHLETECKCRPETCGFCKKQVSLNKLKVRCLLLFIVPGNNWAITIAHYRASDRSRKKVKFRGIFGDKFAEKSADFAGISRKFSGQTSPKSSQ